MPAFSVNMRREKNGWTVIVENIVGANGVIAASNVARAAPDGYTVMITTNTTHAANQSMMKSLALQCGG